MKIILYTAISLDNFIARENGDTSWLHSSEYALKDEDFGYRKFYDSIGCTLMGNTTYKVVNGFDVPFPYADKENYVFTRASESIESNYVKFINSNIPRFINKLKNDSTQDCWLIGGGELNTILLQNNLIDSMILTIIPQVLGQGISLFKGNTHESLFKLDQHKSFANGFVQLTYSSRI